MLEKLVGLATFSYFSYTKGQVMTSCGLITFNYFHKDLRHERFYNNFQLTESLAEIHTHSGIAVTGTRCSQKHINIKKQKTKTACCCAIGRDLTNVEIENA